MGLRNSTQNAASRLRTAAEEEEKRRRAAQTRKSTDTRANNNKATPKDNGAKNTARNTASSAGKSAAKSVKQTADRKRTAAKTAGKTTAQKAAKKAAETPRGKHARQNLAGAESYLDRQRYIDDVAARTNVQVDNIARGRYFSPFTTGALDRAGLKKYSEPGLKENNPNTPAGMLKSTLTTPELDRIFANQELTDKSYELGTDKLSIPDLLAATATLDPLSALKADSASKANYGRARGMQSKSETLTDKEKIKNALSGIKETRAQARRDQAAKTQTLSRYDNRLREQFRQEIKKAKADYDLAKARGDRAAMTSAHRRAETWRRIEGGYSGGTAGNEYIIPELSDEEKAALNEEGQIRLRAAKIGWANSWNDTDRNMYAAQGVDIRKDPKYQKEKYDRGAYREADAEGRMRYAGTEAERQKEKEQAAAIPAAIGTGVAGSFLSIPGTTSRALHTDAARNQAALQTLSDIRGGGEVNISEPEPLTEPTLGQRLLQKSDAYREKSLEGQKGLERYLTEALITGGEMIPGLAATALTGGATAPGLAVMGLQAAGGRMGRLEAAGADPTEAFNRGLVTGAIEAGTELIPLRNLTKIARGGGRSFGANLLAQTLEEAGTEVASDYLNYAADKAFRDPNAAMPTLQDVKDTAIISALTSLGMGTGAGIIGGRRAGHVTARQERVLPEDIQQAADNLRQAAAELDASQARTRAMREDMRTAEADIQAREADLNRREQRALERMERSGDSETAYNFFKNELEQVRQEKVQLEQDRARLNAETQQRRQAKEAQRQAEAEAYQGALDALRPRQTEMPEARVQPPMPIGYEAAAQRPQEADPVIPPTETQEPAEVQRARSPGYDTAENHIDNRQTGEVNLGDRKIKAFQWDHPEVKPFFQKAAAALKQDVEYADSTKHSQRASKFQQDRGKQNGTIMAKNDIIRKLMDKGLSTTDIIKACDAIINDEGQENYATAKRVELALDDMLSRGYLPAEAGSDLSARVAPDEEYLRVKEGISGAVTRDSFEHYLRRNRLPLELGEVTEDELRQEWEAQRARTQEAETPAEPEQYASMEDELQAHIDRVAETMEDPALQDMPESYWDQVYQEAKAEEQAIREKWAQKNTPQEAEGVRKPQYMMREKPLPSMETVIEEENVRLSDSDLAEYMKVGEREHTRNAKELKKDTNDTTSQVRTSNGQDSGYKPFVPEYSISQTEPERNRNFAEEAEKVSGEDRYSVGAAPGGFDAFSDWQNESDRFHPINEKAYERTAENRERAQVEVPVFNRDGRRVSKAFSTLVNANVVPNEILPTLENKAANGEYAYEVNTDQAAKARARDYVERNGFMQAYADWQAQRESGKYGKDNTTLGLELANQAMNSGTEEGMEFGISLAADLIHDAHDAASAMQAWGMINRLSPEGQLFSIAKTVDRINRDAAERRQKSKKKQTEFDFLLQSREDALDIIRTMANEYRAEYDKPQGIENEPSSKRTWVEQLGAELAKNLSGRLNTPTNTPTPIAKTILGDLVKFAEEHAIPNKPKSERRTRTAADRITDYFNNREEYNTAWQLAQKEIRERYKENENDSEEVRQRKQEARDAFEDWLNSTISYNAESSDATMLRAILDSSKEFDNVPIRSEYDRQAITEDIYNQLNRQVQAEGPDATILHNAVERWVNEKALDSGTANEKKIGRDIQKTMRTLGVKMSDLIRKGAKTKEGVAQKIAQMLTEQYGISEDGAAQISEAVLEQYNQAVKEASERALASKFKTRNGRRAKTALEHLEELSNLGAFTSDEYSSLASEKVTGYKDAKIDPELARQFVEAQDQTERDQIAKEIYKDIARQVPPTWADKFNAFRYVSMLGNPRTQVRNIVGNLGFQPVRIAKNAVGTALERAAKVDQSQRTKSLQFKALSKADRTRYQAGLDEYDQVESVIMGNGKYNDSFTDIDKYRRIFKSRFLEGWRDLTNAGLEQGDVFFAKRTYADSLAGILKARGITAEEYKSSSFPQETKEEIRAIAVTEAQKATYRDLNKFSKWVNSLGKGPNTPKAVHYLTEGLLPFKKTPANILVRGIEYSPVGLLNGIKDMATKVKSGEMTAAEGLDEIASGLTGTGLLGLGVLLASMGLVTPGADEDDKQKAFDELLGKQSYALNLPGGYSVTLDWMAPEAIPFFMGVEALNNWDNIKTGEKGKDVAWNALRRISDPVLEMSMLQGVNDLIENVSYSDNKAMSILATLATGYLSQYIPTIGGQIERTLEDRRYSTWIDRDSWVPNEIQYLLAKNANKIPGLEYHQREYLNAWGELEMTGSPLFRALSNFASPGYIKKKRGGEVEAELQRLYDAGFDVLPTIEKTSSKINGEYVTMDQFNLLQGTKGRTTYDFYAKTIASPEYQELSDADKAKVLNREAEYAKAMGQVAAGRPLETLDSWAKNAGSLSESTGIGVDALIEASGIAQAINARDGETALNKALSFYEYMDKKKYSPEQQETVREAYFESNAQIRGLVDAINSGKVSKESAEKFMDSGKEFDVNDDGKLNQDERINALEALGLPYEESKALFEAGNSTDENGNVKTTYEDKLASVEKAKRIEANEEKANAMLDSSLSSSRKSAFLAALPSGKALHEVTQQQMVDAFKAMGATGTEQNAIYKAINASRETPWTTPLNKIIKSKW